VRDEQDGTRPSESVAACRADGGVCGRVGALRTRGTKKRMTTRVSTLVCGLGSILMACDTQGEGPVTALPYPPTGISDLMPSEIVVAPKADTIFAIGDMAAFGAVVVGQDQTALAGVAVSWASRAPDVFTVGRTSGVVIARAEGTGVVEAFVGPTTGEAMVVVVQIPVALSLAGPDSPLAVGDTLRLDAVLSDANGYPVSGRTLSWSSSNPTVASVDGGLVRAHESGRAIVSVRLDALEAVVELVVS
jgi:hypothetical protein